MLTKSKIISIALAVLVAPALVSAQTLRFGLAEDPDILDPTLARTFVGRIVFAALCDKLFDIDEKLNIVPQAEISIACGSGASPSRVGARAPSGSARFPFRSRHGR